MKTIEVKSTVCSWLGNPDLLTARPINSFLSLTVRDLRVIPLNPCYLFVSFRHSGTLTWRGDKFSVTGWLHGVHVFALARIKEGQSCFLCLTNQAHAMQICGWVGAIPPRYHNRTTKGEWSSFTSWSLYSRGKNPDTYWIVGFVGSRAGIYVVKKRQNSCPYYDPGPDCSIVQPIDVRF
jgi:hypothetical protein